MMKASKSWGGDYDCLQEWPDNTYLQCGDSGIVFSKTGNYSTAFFEAFPKNPSTFIRGQGKDIAEAELNAWNKYQKILNCTGHEYVRHGDEHGTCIHCNLFTSHCFPPEHQCHVCEKKHVNYLNFLNEKDYFCREHYLELFSETVKVAQLPYSSENGLYQKREAARYQLNTLLITQCLLDLNLIDLTVPEYIESNRIDDLTDKLNVFVHNTLLSILNTMREGVNEVDKIKFKLLAFVQLKNALILKHELYRQLINAYLTSSTVNDSDLIVFITEYYYSQKDRETEEE